MHFVTDELVNPQSQPERTFAAIMAAILSKASLVKAPESAGEKPIVWPSPLKRGARCRWA